MRSGAGRLSPKLTVGGPMVAADASICDVEMHLSVVGLTMSEYSHFLRVSVFGLLAAQEDL